MFCDKTLLAARLLSHCPLRTNYQSVLVGWLRRAGSAKVGLALVWAFFKNSALSTPFPGRFLSNIIKQLWRCSFPTRTNYVVNFALAPSQKCWSHFHPDCRGFLWWQICFPGACFGLGQIQGFHQNDGCVCTFLLICDDSDPYPLFCWFARVLFILGFTSVSGCFHVIAFAVVALIVVATNFRLGIESTTVATSSTKWEISPRVQPFALVVRETTTTLCNLWVVGHSRGFTTCMGGGHNKTH